MSLFDRDKSADRTPVSLITGFLGSGKTTVLNHLLRHPGMADSAVIVNEFGEIGLDHLLIEAVSGEVAVMANGCICCTVRSDLADTLRRLLAQRDAGEVPPFSRVLIETTGLADPAPIVQMLLNNPLVSHFARLDAVVTTVDAVNAHRQIEEHPEAVKQIALADRLLLTKTDLAQADLAAADLAQKDLATGLAPTDLPTSGLAQTDLAQTDLAQTDRTMTDLAGSAALRKQLVALNPAAPVIEVRHGVVSPDRLFGAALFDPARKIPDVRRWLNEDAYRDHDHDHHGNGGDSDAGNRQTAVAHAGAADRETDGGGLYREAHDHRKDAAGSSNGDGGDGGRGDEGPRHADRGGGATTGAPVSATHAGAYHHHGAHAIAACCLTFETPLAWDAVSTWLAALRQHRGGDLLRIKGILCLRDEEGPVVIHGVHHVFHPPVALDRWPDDDHRSRIVVIARNLARSELEESAAAFGVGNGRHARGEA